MRDKAITADVIQLKRLPVFLCFIFVVFSRGFLTIFGLIFDHSTGMILMDMFRFRSILDDSFESKFFLLAVHSD